MSQFNLNIINLDYLEPSDDFDIAFDVRLVLDENLIYSSLINASSNGLKVKIKLNHKEKNDLTKDDFLFVPESNMLFYKGLTEWLIIDLANKLINRITDATLMWSFERKEDVIIIYDELYAESTDLNGEKIDRVPIDPPYESEEFEDRIEFDSLVYGKQTLSLKK